MCWTDVMLREGTRTRSQEIRCMSLRSMLTNPFTVEMARRWRNVFIGPDWNAFHRDHIYQGLVYEVLAALPVTSFVETGTWRGDSTQAIAMRHPKLPIF